MKDSARYVKIVECSDEDQCYIGSAPGLIFGGCHGDDEKQVFEEAKLHAAANGHRAFIETNPDRVKSYSQDPRVQYAA